QLAADRGAGRGADRQGGLGAAGSGLPAGQLARGLAADRTAGPVSDAGRRWRAGAGGAGAGRRIHAVQSRGAEGVTGLTQDIRTPARQPSAGGVSASLPEGKWIPAFAGMTVSLVVPGMTADR